MSIVGVSGSCSYLGIHLVLELLQGGNKVRCLLYKPKQYNLRYTKAVEYLSSLMGVYERKLSLFHVEDILNSDQTVEGALRDCEVVFHIPLGFTTLESNNNILTECLDPIVQSSLKLYQCILREAQRRLRASPNEFQGLRVIFAGTCHSVDDLAIGTELQTEESWNRHSDMDDPLTMAKTLAERALWELCQSEEAKQVRLEVISLLFPTLIGPVPEKISFTLSQEFHLLSNNSLLFDLLSGYYSACLPIYISILDIRDAIGACTFALEYGVQQPGSYNRFLITNESCWIKQISQLLKDNFPNEAIPASTMSYLRAKLFLMFCKSSIRKRFKSEKLGSIVRYSNEKMREELGYAPRYSIQDTVLDTAHSLLDSPVIRKQKQLLAFQKKWRMIKIGSAMLGLSSIYVLFSILLKKLDISWKRLGRQMIASLTSPMRE